MSYTLEIERPEEIRCSYCLSWNNKKSTICGECTTALYDSNNFGATRALFSWEKTNSSELKYVFSAEKKDKIDYWNSIFRVQFEFFQKEFPYYNFLSKYAILDIQDEISKYFLSALPMRPEVFKEFKEYEFPKNNTNEIELLNFAFRTHPSLLFKALAGLALIQVGRADLKILQYLNEWNAHYKKINQEKYLGFAHWSAQKMNFFKYYSSHINDVMPITNQSDSAASWAKIYLYKADYNVQELKFELEKIIATEKTQLAVSACFALRKFDKIKDLLLNDLDESTIDLAFIYSDERHIPSLLLFLKHAPRKYHESIIRRCVQLKPKDEQIKLQVVDWLLHQDESVLCEVLFDWEEIPRLDEVLSKLLQDGEGIQALSSFFPTWMRNNQRTVSENETIQLILSKTDSGLDAKAAETLKNLQIKIREVDFDMLCEDIRKKAKPEAVKELFVRLFSSVQLLQDRQIADGFSSLIRAAENTKATEHPYFVFSPQWGIDFDLSETQFHKQVFDYLNYAESQRPVSNWLFALYDMLMNSKTELVFEKDVFEKHIDFVFQQVSAQRLDTGTSTKFFKLLVTLKQLFTLTELQQQQLHLLTTESNDFEMKYWIEQIEISGQ